MVVFMNSSTSTTYTFLYSLFKIAMIGNTEMKKKKTLTIGDESLCILISILISLQEVPF